MPRNASGTFSWPAAAARPVVTGTLISSTAQIAADADVVNELTASLDRSGKGGMLAPIRTPNGNAAAPAHSFTNEGGTGLYLAGAANPGLSVNGTKRQEWNATGTIVAGTVGCSDATLATEAATKGQLDAHITDAADAHAASAITNTPAGNIAATTVQAALNELDTEKASTGDLALKAPLADPTFTGTVTVPALTGSEAATVAVNKGFVDALGKLQTIAVDTDIGTNLTTVFTIPSFSQMCMVEVMVAFSFGSCTPSMTFRANTSAGDAGNAWFMSKLLAGSSGNETLATTADVQAIDAAVWSAVTGAAASTNATWYFRGIVRTSAAGTLALQFQNSAASTTVKAGSWVFYRAV